MWKMIVGQSIYQLVVTFTLYFAGARILSYNVDENPTLQLELDTIVFNTFVWMQIFNEFNNRRLDNKLNIFEGMLRNYWFIGINCLMVGGQILIIFVGDVALSVKRINGGQWALCILCAIFCVPWAIVLRCIPDRHFQVIIDLFSAICMFFWRPFSKAMSFIFSPVKRMSRSMFRPLKRFSKRLMTKGHKNDSDAKTSDKPDEKEKQPDDEEAQCSKPAKEKEGNSGNQPAAASVPPITLTVPN